MSSQSQKLSPTEESNEEPTEEEKKELAAGLETYKDVLNVTRDLFHKFPRKVLSTIFFLIEIADLAEKEMDRMNYDIEKIVKLWKSEYYY